MNWRELKSNGFTTLGGAVSGGLDSCTATHWLRSKGFSVSCFTVDLAQPDEENLNAIADRMLGCGADEAAIVPGVAPLADAGLKVIQSQARYEGGYWNTTGIARPVTVRAILTELEERGIGVMFHGATGRGNDQVRFQLAANVLDPSATVYAPWRDPEFVEEFPGRQQMLEYCEAQRPAHQASRRGPLLDRCQPARPDARGRRLGRYHHPARVRGARNGRLGMGRARPGGHGQRPLGGGYTGRVERNAARHDCNVHRGQPHRRNARRRDRHARRGEPVRGREVAWDIRSPGMELLGRSYEYLLQLVLDRRARELFDLLSGIISVQIYQGYWLDLATSAALAALEPITKLVSGTVVVRLYKGQIYFEAVDETDGPVPYSLYTDDSSMEALGSYDHSDAEGFLKVLGISAKNVGTRQFGNFGR